MLSITQLQSFVQDYIDKTPFSKAPYNLYEPADYIFSIGGKRLRPVLLLMGYNLYQSKIEAALPAAHAIEIFHNFSLVHDDIMDEAPLRRGKVTVHHKWDINTGILSGDVMLVAAYEQLLEAAQEKAYPVIKLFNQAAREVCEGQQLDMDFETRADVSLEEYTLMIQYKTGALIAAAIQIGALLGGASEKDAALLADYATKLGIAFQIQDDILDTYGDPAKFGKKVGGDICQNKKTYLVLTTLEKATTEDAAKLKALMETSPEDEVSKIASVKAIFDKYDIKGAAAKSMLGYLDAALASLAEVDISAEKKEHLHAFGETLVKRDL